MTTPINPEWITPKQAAQEFGVSESTLRRWAKDRKIQRIMVGKQSFYKRHEIIRQLAIRKADKGRKK